MVASPLSYDENVSRYLRRTTPESFCDVMLLRDLSIICCLGDQILDVAMKRCGVRKSGVPLKRSTTRLRWCDILGVLHFKCQPDTSNLLVASERIGNRTNCYTFTGLGRDFATFTWYCAFHFFSSTGNFRLKGWASVLNIHSSKLITSGSLKIR